MVLALGVALVHIALLTATGALILGLMALRERDPRNARYSSMLSHLATLWITFAMLALLWALLSSDLSVRYVLMFTSKGLPSGYKASALWAGQEGSFLLWTWMVLLSTSLAPTYFLWTHGPGKKTKDLKGDALRLLRMRIVCLTIAVLFLCLLELKSPFETSTIAEQATYPDGRGLNPLLRTPLMVLHPLMTLVGYGLATVSVAWSATYLLSGDRRWACEALPWTRLTFMFLTLGIALGSVWSYVTFGWGGYWAWDPVEVASLLPWLATAAMLHMQVSWVKRRDFQFLGPGLGMFLLTIILFATFVTRAGGAWESIHAYASNVSGDAKDQFWRIINSDQFLTGLFYSMVASLTVGILVFLRAFMRVEEESPPLKVRATAKGLLNAVRNMRVNILVGTVLIIMGMLVTLFIMVSNVGKALVAEEFEVKLAPFALAAVAFVTLHNLSMARDRRLGIVVVIVGAISGIIAVFATSVPPLAAFSIPFLVAGAVGSVFELVRAFTARPGQKVDVDIVAGKKKQAKPVPKPPIGLKHKVKAAGAPVIHLGIIFLLLGYVGSTWLSMGEENVVATKEGNEALGYMFKVKDLDRTADSESVTLEVLKDGRHLGTMRTGWHIVDGVKKFDIGILTVQGEDIYVTLKAGLDLENGPRAVLDVKVIPMMPVLWSGAALVAIGIVMRMPPTAKGW